MDGKQIFGRFNAEEMLFSVLFYFVSLFDFFSNNKK